VPGIAVVLNAAAGTGQATGVGQRIAELFADRGRMPRITVVSNGAAVREAAQLAVAEGCDVLVAGGGDGTVSAAAASVAGREIPLGVLPLGTLNHFAKDLGIPLELEAAAAVVLAGKVQSVDVGEVNEQIFVNNSSLGVYPSIVRLRNRFRESVRAKWLAALWATLAVLRRRPFLAVRISSPDRTLVRRTPFVLVGNNEYRMMGLLAASRDSLTRGKLAVYLMNAERRRGLLVLGWKVLLRGAGDVEELDLLRVDEATAETRRGSIPVAVDGEVVQLASPLHYRSRPGALRVFVP
jgi:diacylglycerol kinase family enzyme